MNNSDALSSPMGDLLKAPAQKPLASVIVADADYVDRVAFHLIVNFERMLGRRIPQADMARWLECVALDGGLLPDASRQTIVVLLHDKDAAQLQNFRPAHYERELHEKAFAGPLGEFVIHAVGVEAMTTKDDLLCDVLQLAAQSFRSAPAPSPHHLMVVPDGEQPATLQRVHQLLRGLADGGTATTTLFAMQPPATGRGSLRHEILGYSLMQALGIRADELK